MQLLFDLVYREKGEKKSRQLKIDFVSNYMRREIGSFFQDAFKVKYNWDQINDILVQIVAAKTTKAEGYREEIARLDAERAELIEDIKKYSDLTSKNAELAIDLLRDNGVKDEQLLDPIFWDKCVEPSQINDLLVKALGKDSSKKKGNI